MQRRNVRFWTLLLLTFGAVILSFILLSKFEAAMGYPTVLDWPLGFVVPGLIWLVLFATGLVCYRAQALWLLLVAPIAAWPLVSPCSFVPCH